MEVSLNMKCSFPFGFLMGCSIGSVTFIVEIFEYSGCYISFILN